MPGASSWLGLLPLAEFSFALNKSEFRDALSLRYGEPLKTPCDFKADILSRIVNDVETEQELQPVTGETIEGLSENALRPDIKARGVWRASQNAFFDVRVTNTHSPSQVPLTIESVLKKHE